MVFVQNLGVNSIDFLKIDIEGYVSKATWDDLEPEEQQICND